MVIRGQIFTIQLILLTAIVAVLLATFLIYLHHIQPHIYTTPVVNAGSYLARLVTDAKFVEAAYHGDIEVLEKFMKSICKLGFRYHMLIYIDDVLRYTVGQEINHIVDRAYITIPYFDPESGTMHKIEIALVVGL
ncbi:MAG: hypothetical protein DRJ40_10850 [Thermoprotei archaeon]|nr:MAG: hypothetical protein DRJ40_10850 [Thermoprotei archaeon]